MSASTAIKLTPLQRWVLRRAGAADLTGLRRYQLEALRRTVARARERSSFYAGALAGIGPGDLRTLDDVRRLPFTTADDLRREGMRLLCVNPGEVARIVTLPTSGTTGEPKRVQFTTADQELTIDFFQHGMSVLVARGDRVLILLPGERPGSVGDLLRLGLARMDVEGVVHGPVRHVHEALDVLVSGRFDAVVGIPVQVLALARRSVLLGLDLRLKSVLLSTDHAAQTLIDAIEAAWRCRVFDHYGTTEMGLGGGVECEAHEGYHLRENDLLFEVVDPASGAPLPDGEYGEVVFTTLTREAMPLIRYRTGDRSRFLPGPCPCGAGLGRLERVRSRFMGRVPLPGGGELDLGMLDEALFALPGVVDVAAHLMGGDDDRYVLSVGLTVEGDLEATRLAAAAALERVPCISGADGAGRLRVEVTGTPASRDWSDGTAKRTLARSHTVEDHV